MPTTHVDAKADGPLQRIADTLWKARKVVVVAGAGISTNSGIPDFRSENGLYSLVQAQFDAAAKLEASRAQVKALDVQDGPDNLDDPPAAKRRRLNESEPVAIANVKNASTSASISGSQDEQHGEERSESTKLRSDATVTASREPLCQMLRRRQDPQLLFSSSPPSSPPSMLFDPFEDPSNSDASEPDISSVECADDLQAPSSQTLSSSQSSIRRTLPNLKGRDLFDASIWSDPLRTSVFYTFTTTLRQKARDTAPTKCHHFIAKLRDHGKLVRCYTQNIDQLETRVGLETELSLGPGSRSRFTRKLKKRYRGAKLREAGSRADAEEATAVDQTGGIEDDLEIRRNSTKSSNCTVPQLAEHSFPTSADTSQSSLDGTCMPAHVANDALHQDGKPIFIAGIALSGHHSPRAEAEEHSLDALQTSDLPAASPEARNDNETSNAAAYKPSEASSQLSVPSATGPASLVKTESALSEDLARDSRGVECVLLHGALDDLRCFVCGQLTEWDELEIDTLAGDQPCCPNCEEAATQREEKGKRALGVGKLRPNIVLYGEEHPNAQLISDVVQHDLALVPDVLLILGTSLRVHGLKVMIREFARAIHSKGGMIVFVNFTKPSDSIWSDVIDYWVEMDCDSWVDDVQTRKPRLWLPPGYVEEKPVEAEKQMCKVEGIKRVAVKSRPPKLQKPDTKPSRQPVYNPDAKRPNSTRDHKLNGAYLTSKIIDTLKRMTSGHDNYSKPVRASRGESSMPSKNRSSDPTEHSSVNEKAQGATLDANVLLSIRAQSTVGATTNDQENSMVSAVKRNARKRVPKVHYGEHRQPLSICSGNATLPALRAVLSPESTARLSLSNQLPPLRNLSSPICQDLSSPPLLDPEHAPQGPTSRITERDPGSPPVGKMSLDWKQQAFRIEPYGPKWPLPEQTRAFSWQGWCGHGHLRQLQRVDEAALHLLSLRGTHY